ncbi:MAG: helix-turn-helix domain-containing protein [Chitinophagaceae bacterium]|nr:helix-turn-helix domain-containing protein [Chitinophagaceae bacterium]
MLHAQIPGPIPAKSRNGCLSVRSDKGITLSNAWHYHSELELTWLQHTQGTRIVGSSIEPFSHNDLVLIGKNTPHAFLHEKQSMHSSQACPEAITILFRDNFLGREFFNLPELNDIHQLFYKARQGLCITDAGKMKVIPLMNKFLTADPFARILLLLEILKILTREDAHRLLITSNLNWETDDVPEERFNSVLEYTYRNFDRPISLDVISKVAHLTKESFCRYFKSKARKTYVAFLTEYRISKACSMIGNNNKTIKEIGYTCGFDSLSNFYHQFKKITTLSPLEYRQLYENSFFSCP